MPDPSPEAKSLKLLRSNGTDSANRLNAVNRRMVSMSRRFINAACLGAGDVAAMLLGFLCADLVYYLFNGTMMMPEYVWFQIGIWLVAASFTRLLPGWGFGPVEELRRVTLLMFALFAATTTMLFLWKVSVESSRLNLTMAFLFTLPLLLLFRKIIRAVLRRLNLWGMPTILYANLHEAKVLIQSLRDESGLGYIPSAVITLDPKPNDPESILGVPVIPEFSPVPVVADAALLAAPERSQHEILDLLEGPLAQYHQVVVVPDMVDTPSLWVQPRDLGGLLGLEISHNLHNAWSRALKRLSEILFILASFPIWFPLTALIALLIWLSDRGSPFYVQPRVGSRLRVFSMVKFRTMHPDAETILAEKLASDPSFKQAWDGEFKLQDDPRITAIGRFLRRTSLDELPQILNVLHGEMALVGPRPLPGYHDAELPDRVRRLRASVKPGMTGLWQVSGRSDAGTDGIIKWDSYYVRNWSLWLDIVILLRTIRVIFTGKGAY